MGYVYLEAFVLGDRWSESVEDVCERGERF